MEYNIFRWYRSGWGRYTQSDPIGLRGGYNLFQYAAADPVGTSDPLGLEIRRCFRPFGNPRTRFIAAVAAAVFQWHIFQPPLPGARACLMHEYIFNTTTGTSMGYDPREMVQETGRDICYPIPEPVGTCVWNEFAQTAGPLQNYDLLRNNCQTTVNETVRRCTSRCYPPPRNVTPPSPSLADPRQWTSMSRH